MANTHPLRENLEVVAALEGSWIRCMRCRHVLSIGDQDWMEAAHRVFLALEAAGPLFQPFREQLAIDQLCCPSCGALLNTEKRIIPTSP